MISVGVLGFAHSTAADPQHGSMYTGRRGMCETIHSAWVHFDPGTLQTRSLMS